MRQSELNPIFHGAGVPGQAEEHDIPVRTRDLPDVRGPDERVSHLQEDCGEEDTALLNTQSHTHLFRNIMRISF